MAPRLDPGLDEAAAATAAAAALSRLLALAPLAPLSARCADEDMDILRMVTALSRLPLEGASLHARRRWTAAAAPGATLSCGAGAMVHSASGPSAAFTRSQISSARWFSGSSLRLSGAAGVEGEVAPGGRGGQLKGRGQSG